MNQVFPRSCLPTPAQELILRAALLDPDKAATAWNEWKRAVSIEDIDSASYRLLPLAYANLKSEFRADPFIQRIKGVHRHTWSKNHVLMQSVSDLLRSFERAQIPAMLLKGAALLHAYYRDYALRPMNDVDVMVPVEQAESAIELLKNNGYIPDSVSPLPFSERYIPLIHAYGFSISGRVSLDLHWHLLEECRQPGADDDFWEGASTMDFCGMAVPILNPADQLLHILVHGMRWNPTPPVRWVADAMIILRSSDLMDWARIVRQCKNRNLSLPVLDALQYLHDVFYAPVPAYVLSELRTVRTTWIERIEYGYKLQDHSKRVWGNLPLLWFSYCRSANGSRLYRKAIGFIRHLQAFWGADSWWQLPEFAFVRLLRRLRIVVNGRKDNQVFQPHEL